MAQHTFHTDTSLLSGEQRFQPAWWRVDLGASYDVYQVIIVNRNYFRGKCVPDRNLELRQFSGAAISKIEANINSKDMFLWYDKILNTHLVKKKLFYLYIFIIL